MAASLKFRVNFTMQMDLDFKANQVYSRNIKEKIFSNYLFFKLFFIT